MLTLDDLLNNEEEEQKRRAAERISKLRNLSFNMNSGDANAEYDNVPAYVRRNMELFGNTLTSVEQFYSKYTVKKDENEETKISTINTFLDGKKPDYRKRFYCVFSCCPPGICRGIFLCT